MLEGPKKIQWMNRCRKSAMALVVGKWTWAEIGYPKMGREWVNPCVFRNDHGDFNEH